MSILVSDDRFKFVKELGRGGQGIVFLAEDTLFGGNVAIKILNSEATLDASFLRRLLMEEAKLQATICPPHAPHRNIVCIIDARPIEDDIGIIMEYVDGGSVSDLLRPKNQRKLLSVSQALEISLQVCEGLVAAHEKNVIHRDIKPRNLLIRRADGTVKIADWGIAKNIEIAGIGRTFAGTPPYMSPEVILLNRKSQSERLKSIGVDHRTDIYSLGVTIFEMLTGDFPFDSDDGILSGVTNRQEMFLIDRGIEPTLVAIILKAMACKPEDRYQTAREMQDALRDWQNAHLLSDELKAAWDLYLNRHDAAAAEKKFLDCLARYPNSPQAFLGLGRFYIQCSRDDNAIEVLSKGIEIAPDFAPLWNARGRLYAKRNSPLALDDLQKALDLDLPKKDKQQIRSILNRLRKNERRRDGS
ncbi:MAG: protein kinase [Blastocatellia bacterium]|nr:protein kinase [Blastocatellia bacterium]